MVQTRSGDKSNGNANAKRVAEAEKGGDKKKAKEGGKGAKENGAAAKDTAKEETKKEETVTSADALKVGEYIPKDVSLLDENDKSVHVIEALGSKGAVFFIYPKANTPGCTTQACSFRDSHSDFEKLGFKVYALSRDLPKAQLSWKEKHEFPFNLLCDPEQKLIKPLGASKSATSVTRSHFVVDHEGKLLLASVGVKPATSTSDALEFVKSVSESK